MTSRKERHQSKWKMKRKLLIIFSSLAVMAGAGQVYAATLNSNLLELIKNGVNSIEAFYLTKSDTDMAQLKDKYKQEAAKIVDDTTNNAVNSLDQYEQSEKNRADQQLNTYLNDLKKQVSDAANQEADNSEQRITDNVNQNINQIEKEMDQVLQQKIAQTMKK